MTPQTTRPDLALPSRPGFIALLEAFRATGGTAPGEVVSRLLVEHQTGRAVSLARLIETGQVFGFDWRASLWIPMFQFDADDLAPSPGAQRVRAALPALWSGWSIAAWFAGAGAGPDGQRPADLLASDLESVVRAARSLTSAGASAQTSARASAATFAPVPLRRKLVAAAHA